MNRIHDSLQRVFERNRLVFWYDPRANGHRPSTSSQIRRCKAQGCAWNEFGQGQDRP